MNVMKFGGSSVKNHQRISAVIDIVKKSLTNDADCIVVVSAFGGVTDILQQAARSAEAGKDFETQIIDLKQRHLDCLTSFLIEDEDLSKFIDDVFDALSAKLSGIKMLQELTPKALDFILATGEKLSARIITAACIKSDIKTNYVDTCSLLMTDNSFGSAIVNRKQTYQNFKEYFANNPGLNIVTGYIGSNPDGKVTTIGRGGSDYTAALIGAALKCDEITIWTDVDGLYTADPNKVIKAFPKEHVSFAEAMELSHFGAKVIYPPAVQPALDQGITIYIKNSYNPKATGTIVSKESSKDQTSICGISSITEVAFLRIEGSGMIGRKGTARRLFEALANSEINVLLISQASSEYTICVAVRPEQAKKAELAINNEFTLEIENKIILPVILQTDTSIISIVGESMRTVPGIAGKMFSALGKNGVNVIAIAQGSSELNISAVISNKDEVKALKVLHEEFFFPDTKTINLCLVGTGLIGSELIEQIKTHASQLEQEHYHQIRVIGLANSRKMLFDVNGIEPKNLSKDNLEHAENADLEDLITKVKSSNLPNLLFVDCTASEDICSQYLNILRSNISIATPNKKSQTSDFAYYQQLKKAAKKRGINFLYETSVGAGLPVISTLNDLLKSGDEIIKIEGVLSGTLSYIFNSFSKGQAFSDIVKQAMEAGYTEPDPRDDLNGLDVARKILILARECGHQLELNDVQVDNLVPENCRETESIEQFFTLLKESDAYFSDKLEKAAKQNGKLCYIAKLENGTASVELATVTPNHPFYNLSGSDNIISFTTKLYNDRPLVVKGPGAGAAVTAAGVFADIIRLANY